ncbi:MAG TPA: hypothetical protein VL197_04415 [Nitrospirota bacterium]|nr:hypothetical protein [Nitrospirota bacterium]
MIIKQSDHYGLLRYGRYALLLLLLLQVSCFYNDDDNECILLPFLPLTAGVPFTDVVYFGGFNTYGVSVIPGSLYKISITGLTDDSDLVFFGTDGTFTFQARCPVDNTAFIGLSSEDCVIAAPGNTLYFAVDGSFLFTSAGLYTIDVEPLTITDLTVSLPASDTAAVRGAGVYSLPVTTGTVYTVGMTALTNDADMYVFNDALLTSKAICAINNTQFTGTTPEDCTLTASGSTLNFIIDGIFSTSPSVSYTALGTPAPAIPVPVNEGTPAAPVALAIDAQVIGQVASGPTGSSYYVVHGLTPNSRYTVSINGLTNNADLSVYDNDATFTTLAVCSIDNTSFAGTTPEDCTLTAAGASLYFKVTSNTTSGGLSFISLVESGP